MEDAAVSAVDHVALAGRPPLQLPVHTCKTTRDFIVTFELPATISKAWCMHLCLICLAADTTQPHHNSYSIHDVGNRGQLPFKLQRRHLIYYIDLHLSCLKDYTAICSGFYLLLHTNQAEVTALSTSGRSMSQPCRDPCSSAPQCERQTLLQFHFSMEWRHKVQCDCCGIDLHLTQGHDGVELYCNMTDQSVSY